MAVRHLWADGAVLEPGGRPSAVRDEPFSALLRTAVRCNSASIEREPSTAGLWRQRGDPTERALLVAAAQLGEDVESMQAARSDARQGVFSFDPGLKRMTTIDREAATLWVHVKGAPLELLDRCSHVRGAQNACIAARGRAAVEPRVALGDRVRDRVRRRNRVRRAAPAPVRDRGTRRLAARAARRLPADLLGRRRTPSQAHAPRRQRGPERPSRISLRSSRSLRLARRIALAMSGAESLEKPSGRPRLRKVISVAPSWASDQV